MEHTHITGDLSPVDEESSADEELRNNFYLKRGYKIINSVKIYKDLQKQIECDFNLIVFKISIDVLCAMRYNTDNEVMLL